MVHVGMRMLGNMRARIVKNHEKSRDRRLIAPDIVHDVSYRRDDHIRTNKLDVVRRIGHQLMTTMARPTCLVLVQVLPDCLNFQPIRGAQPLRFQHRVRKGLHCRQHHQRARPESWSGADIAECLIDESCLVDG